MKDQKFNQGELKELKVNIEKDVVESVHFMAQNTDYSADDIVVIALRRFISCHADYMNVTPKTDLES